MPNASFIHVACFAVGAVVGGGLATVVSTRKPTPTPPPAVIDLDRNGDAKISTAIATVPTLSTVLKYGHPGGRPSTPSADDERD